jgi:hypothetical protein
MWISTSATEYLYGIFLEIGTGTLTVPRSPTHSKATPPSELGLQRTRSCCGKGQAHRAAQLAPVSQPGSALIREAEDPVAVREGAA